MSALSKGQTLSIEEGIFEIGLSWDFFEGCPATDLDCAALAYDPCGCLVDACFYNQTAALEGCVQHSGDNKTGLAEGMDEMLTIDLQRLSPSISIFALVINAYRGGTLTDVETGMVHFRHQGSSTELCNISIMCGRSAEVKSGIPAANVCALLCRDGTKWILRCMNIVGDGRNFRESYVSSSTVLKALDTVIDPVLRAEHQASMDKTFNMAKNDMFELPRALFLDGEDMFVGLGWTTHCDLDAAVLISDSVGQGGNALNIVNFTDKTFGKAVIHHGDNLTGAGEGDDEKISIDMDYLPPQVKSLWVVVSVFSGSANFAAVKDAYIRLVATKNNHELCRYKLESSSELGDSQGLVFAKIFLNPLGNWTVQAIGKGCQGRTSNDSHTMQACGIVGMAPSHVIQSVEKEAVFQPRKIKICEIRLRGGDLAAKDNFLMGGKSDPFFEIQCVEKGKVYQWGLNDGKGDVIARSNVIKKTLEPAWDVVKFALYESDANRFSFRVVVWDWDKVGSNDLIGSAYLGHWEDMVQVENRIIKLDPPKPPHKQEAGCIKFEQITFSQMDNTVAADERMQQIRNETIKLRMSSDSSEMITKIASSLPSFGCQ